MTPQMDDIVVGAGLTGLAVVAGLDPAGKIAVFTGRDGEGLLSYPGTQMPYAHFGPGGLGAYWHGVIPLCDSTGLVEDRDAFARLFTHFYPSSRIRPEPRADRLFIPWSPIRPAKELAGLKEKRPNLTTVDTSVTSIRSESGGFVVEAGGSQTSGRRLWLAAGAVATPRLLETLTGKPPADTRMISDHIIGYAGQIPASAAVADIMRSIRRDRAGLDIPAFYNQRGDILYTIRPAMFDFATLDKGFEKRAVFGLPLSRGLAGLKGRVSPGLIAEALFNKAAIGRTAMLYSVYYQATLPGLYALDRQLALTGPVDQDAIRALGVRAQQEAPFADLMPSHHPERYLPGIHMHGSLDTAELKDLMALENGAQALHVVDSSALSVIGPEHHSFRVMARAYSMARSLSH